MMERHHQIDLDTGRFYETGLAVAMAGMRKLILDPDRFRRGMELTKRAVHKGGHTTICDMGLPMLNLDLEWSTLKAVMDTDDTPFRTQFVARAVERGGGLGNEAENLERVRNMQKRNTHRFEFRKAVKLFTDGGYFAELMQVQPPGFIDGHEGEWLMPPEVFEGLCRPYWHEGYRIHVHCTGDLGLELALDVLEKLQNERPRFNHRFTIEHFGLSTPEQVRRMADLGALASVNAYYVYELGEAYWKRSLGHERASQMARLGTLMRHNVTTALHTDFTMAPALPLNSAWVAVNRLTESGSVMCPRECITVEQAMRAITIDAAYVLGMEHEVGSIRAGKKADFTVLEADPFEVPPSALKDIPIWGTVFEGVPAPLE
jgi:predicted amidohydrolase YtcJ